MPVSCFQPLGLGISILPPLTRRGHGPGLILLVPDADEQMKIAEGVPSHLVKWAEEGYTVVEIQIQAIKDGGATNALSIALKALWSDERCQPEERIGIVGMTVSRCTYLLPLLCLGPLSPILRLHMNFAYHLFCMNKLLITLHSL